MLAVLETAQTIARHQASVLITGETGSGKEVIARMIHRYSSRSSGPWVDINCAALPEHLVESELFGFEKSAFSGAACGKPGLFELASGGTLFLDEIGEIDPKVQVKLLRALDQAPYYRLGGSRKVTVDVRCVTATNRNLEAAVQAGSFRSDLYHRISEVQIKVPPLRERPRDVIALAEHFLLQRRPDAGFAKDALELLSQLEWPGNVRELRNLVVKLGILVSHDRITAGDVRPHLADCRRLAERPVELLTRSPSTLNEMERLMILRTLEATGGNQRLAAEQLGIPRRTLCRKLNEHQIALGRRRTAAIAASSPLPEDYRAELNVPVNIRAIDGRCFVAEAKNLSLGGMGLQNLRPPLAIFHELTLKFALPGSGHRIEVKASVVWSQPNGTAGVRFTDLGVSRTTLLRNWIAENARRRTAPVDEISIEQNYTPNEQSIAAGATPLQQTGGSV